MPRNRRVQACTARVRCKTRKWYQVSAFQRTPVQCILERVLFLISVYAIYG